MRALVGLGATAAVALVAAVFVFPRVSDGRAGQLRSYVRWDPSCADVVVETVPRARRSWPQAVEARTVSCEHLGPFFMYARFASVADLRADLLRHPPSMAVCIAGLEAVFDGLEGREFERLCGRMHGKEIDAVSGLTDVPASTRIGVDDYWIAVSAERDAAVQGEALRWYFAH